MYIIRPPPMSTRLAKDSARAVVASEQASAIRASNFTTMCFMVVRFSPSIHLLVVRQLPTNHTQSFSIGRGAETLMQINCERHRSNSSVAVPMSALGQNQTFALHQPMSALPPKATSNATYGMTGQKRTFISCSITRHAGASYFLNVHGFGR